MPTLQDEERDEEFRLNPTRDGYSKHDAWAKRVRDQYKKVEDSMVAQGNYAGALYWREQRKDHEAQVAEDKRRYQGM